MNLATLQSMISIVKAELGLQYVAMLDAYLAMEDEGFLLTSHYRDYDYSDVEY
jgi:hypothetical protein